MITPQVTTVMGRSKNITSLIRHSALLLRTLESFRYSYLYDVSFLHNNYAWNPTLGEGTEMQYTYTSVESNSNHRWHNCYYITSHSYLSVMASFYDCYSYNNDNLLFAGVKKQVAQLSQRDRAAGWVSNGQKWKTGTERQYLRTM